MALKGQESDCGSSGRSCSSDSIPGPGTSIHHGCGERKKGRRKEGRKGERGEEESKEEGGRKERERKGGRERPQIHPDSNASTWEYVALHSKETCRYEDMIRDSTPPPGKVNLFKNFFITVDLQQLRIVTHRIIQPGGRGHVIRRVLLRRR